MAVHLTVCYKLKKQNRIVLHQTKIVHSPAVWADPQPLRDDEWACICFLICRAIGVRQRSRNAEPWRLKKQRD